MRNTDNVPRQVIIFAVNYSFELFSGLLHPPALPLTAAEFVCLLQTATPTQVAVVIDGCNGFIQMLKYCKCGL